MATVITQSDAQSQFPELVERVLHGEDIMITRGQDVKLRLVPVGKRYRVPDRLRGKYKTPDSFFDPLTDEELEDWGL